MMDYINITRLSFLSNSVCMLVYLASTFFYISEEHASLRVSRRRRERGEGGRKLGHGKQAVLLFVLYVLNI